MNKYDVIADDIAKLIQQGLYPYATKLPSIRDSAFHYKASINTVKEAYHQLEDRGLVWVKPQSGYYVSHLLDELNSEIRMQSHEDKVPLSGISRYLSVILENQAQHEYVNLALACPSGDAFYPASKINRITSQLLHSHRHLLTNYVLPPESLRLRTQIAKRGIQLGMLLSPEHIIVTHGTMEALNLAIRAVTKPGDYIAVETPTFFNLYPLIEDLGRFIVEIPTHPQHGMCLKSLESLIQNKQVQAVITIPTGHNPLGFTMSETNRRQLAAMANQYQIPVIEDAMYAELQYTESLMQNIKAFDRDGWVLICASYTKTVAPDYRIGWIEAGRFHHIVKQLKFTSSVAESSLLSETIGLFFENGGYDAHLRHLRKLYKHSIERVRSLVAQHFPKGTRVSKPQAGFILWIELPHQIDTLVLFHRALDEHIVCMPGLLCSADKRFSHCLRLAVCNEPNQLFTDSIAKLGSLAHEYM